MKRSTAFALLACACPVVGGQALAQTIADRARAFDGAMTTSLGVTVAQLRDADLIDSSGQDLGEVEAVLLGANGEPASVLVELDDDIYGDDRVVEVQLSALITRAANSIARLWDDDIDLVTQQPAASFGQLPDLRQGR